MTRSADRKYECTTSYFHPRKGDMISPFSSSEQESNVRVTFLKSVPDASKRLNLWTTPRCHPRHHPSTRPRKRRVEVKKKKKNLVGINNNNNTQQQTKIIPGVIWTVSRCIRYSDLSETTRRGKCRKGITSTLGNPKDGL